MPSHRPSRVPQTLQIKNSLSILSSDFTQQCLVQSTSAGWCNRLPTSTQLPKLPSLWVLLKILSSFLLKMFLSLSKPGQQNVSSIFCCSRCDRASCHPVCSYCAFPPAQKSKELYSSPQPLEKHPLSKQPAGVASWITHYLPFGFLPSPHFALLSLLLARQSTPSFWWNCFLTLFSRDSKLRLILFLTYEIKKKFKNVSNLMVRL